MEHGRRDPEIVRVDWFVQRMARLPTGVAKLRYLREQRVADGDDRGHSDRLRQALAALVTPASDQRSVAELGNRDGGEEIWWPVMRAT